MRKPLLLIDTACSYASVLYDSGLSSCHDSALRPEGGHDRFVCSKLEQMTQADPMALKNIETLGVCIGPGRFNGVRVGCSIVATLMSLLKKPAYVVTSFEILRDSDISPEISGYAIFAKRGFAYYQDKDFSQDSALVPISELPFTTHVMEIEGDFIQISERLDLKIFEKMIQENRARSIARAIDLEPLYCALI